MKTNSEQLWCHKFEIKKKEELNAKTIWSESQNWCKDPSEVKSSLTFKLQAKT